MDTETRRLLAEAARADEAAALEFADLMNSADMAIAEQRAWAKELKAKEKALDRAERKGKATKRPEGSERKRKRVERVESDSDVVMVVSEPTGSRPLIRRPIGEGEYILTGGKCIPVDVTTFSLR